MTNEMLLQDIQSRMIVGGALILIALILLFMAAVFAQYLETKSKREFRRT